MIEEAKEILARYGHFMDGDDADEKEHTVHGMRQWRREERGGLRAISLMGVGC